jgi:hypothetical protein
MGTSFFPCVFTRTMGGWAASRFCDLRLGSIVRMMNRNKDHRSTDLMLATKIHHVTPVASWLPGMVLIRGNSEEVDRNRNNETNRRATRLDYVHGP